MDIAPLQVGRYRNHYRHRENWRAKSQHTHRWHDVDSDEMNNYVYENHPARQCSASQRHDIPERDLITNRTVGWEAVSFRYSCIICSMEAGTRGLSRSATGVDSSSRSRAQDKNCIIGCGCLPEVVLCLKTTICYALRPVPVISCPYPLISHHPFAPSRLFVWLCHLLQVAIVICDFVVSLGEVYKTDRGTRARQIPTYQQAALLQTGHLT